MSGKDYLFQTEIDAENVKTEMMKKNGDINLLAKAKSYIKKKELQPFSGWTFPVK